MHEEEDTGAPGDPDLLAAASDADLLRGVAAGDEDAFVALYRRCARDVHRFALAMAKSRSVAQDVTQEVFLNVLENAARFDAEKGSARAWLYGCARHLILDRLRYDGRWAETVPEQAEAGAHEERLHTEQRAERLHAAIARLPAEFRETLVLYELEELSYAECAAVLGCPVGTVRSRLHRARALLGALLRERAAGLPMRVVEEREAGGASAQPTLRPNEVCS